MRIVLQRVSQASVTVPEILDVARQTHRTSSAMLTHSITQGFVLLVGVNNEDGEQEIAWLTHKILHLRVFEDAAGKMNHSILDTSGSILSIPQFTLFADLSHGNRPSFFGAGKPEHAQHVWQAFNSSLRDQGVTVQEGFFGAHMQVSLVNDGPVTLSIDTQALMK